MFFMRWATEMVFWLLMLASLLPISGLLWFVGKLMNSPDLFSSWIINLLRWR